MIATALRELANGRGIPFLRALRAMGSQTLMIIMTALDQLSDRIEGLNAGADDYRVNPLDLSELLARTGAVARRYSGNPDPLIALVSLSVNLADRRVTRAGHAIALATRERALFKAFLQRPGQLLSKPHLEERHYSFDAEVASNTVDVHVSRRRKKLEAGIIVTERGLGYCPGSA